MSRLLKNSMQHYEKQGQSFSQPYNPHAIAHQRPSVLRAVFMDRQNIPLDSFHDVNRQQPQSSAQFRNHEDGDIQGPQEDYRNVANNDDVMQRPNRVHSMHRNDQKHSEAKEVYKAYEARTGGRKTFTGDYTVGNLENHADLIVSKMEKDENLMENSPDSEKLRKEALRDMPQCLTVKRCVKRKLKDASQNYRRKPIGCWKALKYKMSISFTNFKNDLKDLIYIFELWYGPLKEIEGHFGSGVASFFKFLRWIFILNVILMIPNVSFIVIPQCVYKEQIENTAKFEIVDILTGEGFLTNTPLFYGYYSNGSVSSLNLDYNMPNAYFFTNLTTYLFALVVLCLSAAKSYRKSFIETEGGLQNVFAQKVFCGWDFSIANESAAELKSSALYTELRELLAEIMKMDQVVPWITKFYLAMIHTSANVLYFAGLGGIGYLIWYCLRDESSLVTAVVVNLIMLFIPMIFSFLAKYEDYKNPRTVLYITLFRTFLLGFVIIGVLVTYLLKRAENNIDWENSLGQEIYRLILFDFIISVLLSFVVDICMHLVYRMFKLEGHFEYDISRHTMQIIYNQSLYFVGLLYSPLLSVMVVIKLLLTWYIRQITVVKLCKPSAKSWRAARNLTWFIIMVFLSLLLICGFQGYILMYIIPSKTLGPFRNYNYIYEIVTLGLFNLEDQSIFWKILLFITKPGFVALTLIALSIFVYILKRRAESQRDIVEKYRVMLIWMSRDKEVLLRHIDDATGGEWKYRLDESRNFDPINMMPRLRNVRRQNSVDYETDPRLNELSTSHSLIPQDNGAPQFNQSDDDVLSKYKKFD